MTTLQEAQRLYHRGDRQQEKFHTLWSQSSDFEKGILLILHWVSIFSIHGEGFVILLKGFMSLLLQILPKGVSQQNLIVEKLENCLSLSLDSVPIVEATIPDDEIAFVEIAIPPDMLRTYERLAGIEYTDIPPVHDDTSVNIAISSGDSTELLLPPTRVESAPVTNPRKKPRPDNSRGKEKTSNLSGKGFG
jgi:hypothetical protein